MVSDQIDIVFSVKGLIDKADLRFVKSFLMYSVEDLFSVNETPVLKADALKYIIVFRSQVRYYFSCLYYTNCLARGQFHTELGVGIKAKRVKFQLSLLNTAGIEQYIPIRIDINSVTSFMRFL